MPSRLIVAVVAAATALGLASRSSAADADRASATGMLPAAQARPQADTQPDKAALSEWMSPVEVLAPVTAPTTIATAAARPAPPAPGGFGTASPLPTADAEAARSEQLERVAQEADRHTRHGCELAERGAPFAARAEFLSALQLLAEGLDTEHNTTFHSRALAAACTAMKEADDFLPRQEGLEADRDLPGILQTHTTPVLKDRAGRLTPLAALKCYFTFAQEQFAAAAGHEVAGSMALHGLGKLHASLTNNKAIHILAPEPKAMVYYQAALLVYPGNFLAANDLGVLLARYARYADARAVLEYGLALHPQSAGWHNLSVVYRQLGAAALAAQAAQRAGQTYQAEMAQGRAAPAGSRPQVQWLDPAAFAQTSTNAPSSPAAIAPATPAVAAQPATPAAPRSPHSPAAATSPSVGWLPGTPQETRR